MSFERKRKIKAIARERKNSATAFFLCVAINQTRKNAGRKIVNRDFLRRFFREKKIFTTNKKNEKRIYFFLEKLFDEKTKIRWRTDTTNRTEIFCADFFVKKKFSR